MSDPTVETMGPEFKNYGPLKALCEQAVEKAVPGRATIVRPGFIVGPGDGTDRFTYWPVRVARGGEVLAPGTPSDPIQIIDVRDLAEWMLTLVEAGTTGTFNAVGPDRPLTFGEVLETCKKVTGSDARFTWVTPEFVEKVPTELNLPIWAPHEGELKGFHTFSNARALKTGLKFRAVDVTIRDTLAWFRSLPAERQEKMRAGTPPDKEAEALAAWHRDWKK
jgi:2'-hydroxyisoflavone reductase